MILIFTPTIDEQMRAETRASIEAQETDIPYQWEIGRHNPFPGEKMRNVIAQYGRARELCLAGDYDAMLTVEHDMVIPPDTVQTLYMTDAPVVYGVYLLRHGTPVLNAWQKIGSHALGMSLSLCPNELRAARRRGWAEVCGVGWGCTLIRRHVLERLHIYSGGGGDAGDLTFARECLGAGFKQIARFDVVCDHILPDGNILRPFRNGGIVNRVLALQTFNASVNGQTLAVKKDSYYSLPPDVAMELARAGYVKITNEEDSQEEAGLREQPDIGEREMATDPKVPRRSTRKSAPGKP